MSALFESEWDGFESEWDGQENSNYGWSAVRFYQANGTETGESCGIVVDTFGDEAVPDADIPRMIAALEEYLASRPGTPREVLPGWTKADLETLVITAGELWNAIAGDPDDILSERQIEVLDQAAEEYRRHATLPPTGTDKP